MFSTYRVAARGRSRGVTLDEMREEVRLLHADITNLRRELDQLPPERAAAVMLSIAGILEHIARTEATIGELEVRALKGAEGSAKVFSEHMTPAAIEARNKAISQTKGRGDPLIEAIHKAGWSGLNAYAEHLGMSPGSLSAYRNGVRPIPRKWFDRIKKDLRYTDWPKGVEG